MPISLVLVTQIILNMIQQWIIFIKLFVLPDQEQFGQDSLFDPDREHSVKHLTKVDNHYSTSEFRTISSSELYEIVISQL